MSEELLEVVSRVRENNDNGTSEQKAQEPATWSQGDTVENPADKLAPGLEKSEIPYEKEKELVIVNLTQKQPEAMRGRKRIFWIYMADIGPPSSDHLEYTPNRNSFVAKVFGIVFIMFVFTSICCLCSMSMPAVKKFLKSIAGSILMVTASIGLVVISYCFCYDYARNMPLVAILTMLTGFFYTIICMFVCGKYAPYIVLGAAVVTCIIVLLCLGLAFTSIDFTKFIMVVAIAAAACGVAMLFCAVLRFTMGINIAPIRLAILVISSIVNCVLLIIELQMVLGGKTVELTEDEYFYGAYLIYTSVVQLFLKMVRIFGIIEEMIGGGD